MATPQRSRYPRPLKATQSFTSSGSTQAGKSQQQRGSPPSGGSKKGERRSSPERRSPVPMLGSRGEKAADQNPRRSNSMGSLSDPDCYMNSLWPRVPSTNQSECDSEDPVPGSDTDFHAFSHKRSNSCSSDDQLKKFTHPHLRNGQVSSVHTRTSIEGLNQEISSVLEGKPFMPYQYPDGHIAPVRDLLGQMSVEKQTPPHIPTTHSHSSPSSPSPCPTSSPSQPTQTDPDIHTGFTNAQSTESPGTPDYSQTILHPPSPKPSFAREPPDGAERCTIKQEAMHFSADFVPTGPDKSKANIVFQGTVFAPPLLPSAPSLKPVPINSL